MGSAWAWLGSATQSRFGRNVLHVFRANLAAQALPLAAAPLLTRLYGPEAFGALALFSAGLGMVLALATARFEWSLPNARSQRMAAAVGALGAGALALVALATAVMAATLPLPPAWQVLAPLAWVLPLACLGAGLQQLGQAWHVRAGDLQAVGRANVVQSVVGLGLSLAVGSWWLAASPGSGSSSAAGLVWGTALGAWAGALVLLRRAPGLRAAVAALGLRRLDAAWRRFRREAAFSTMASVLNAFSLALIPPMLARHHGVVDVGYYALVHRLALAPVGLVTSAIAQSFWSEAATLVRTDPAKLERLYRGGCRRLAVPAVLLALVALAGPLYVGPLFGAGRWDEAGWVLAALAPLLLAQVVAQPLSHLVVHRRQHWQAAWDLMRAALLLLTIEALGRAGAGIATTVLGVSACMTLMYGLLLVLNLAALRSARRRP